MSKQPFRVENPDRYDIATEIMSSAKRLLQAVGFDETEIQDLFRQVAAAPRRGPTWLQGPKEASGA